MTNGDEYAFPNTIDESKFSAPILTIGGLTKREYFAAMAMQGVLSGENKDLVEVAEEQGLLTKEGVGIVAVEFADALIEALNKNENNS